LNFSSGPELSRRLERAEGHACAMFAEARRRVRPESGAEWMECAGTYAVFNGIDSPVTQTFGLGLFEEVSAAMLDTIERFFFERRTGTDHEVSPFAGVATLDLLCARQYRPVEISSVMYRSVEEPAPQERANVRVHVAGPEDGALWVDIMARGWQNEFVRDNGAIASDCEGSVRFLAGTDGQPGAAGALSVHNGVVLFGGAATVPEMRRRGLQTALIEARMQYAFDHGCDLLMMVAEPGSESQRNAERNGFRIAYTRVKWRLARH
jgi:GNAT superfamily N-acetyltransferase